MVALTIAHLGARGEGRGALMKLLIRRDQPSGLMGKVVFSLQVRADLSADEKACIAKCKLGETELYASHQMIDKG